MSPRPDKIIIRQKYLNKALSFKGISLIKVFTGQRRTGKSYLLHMVADAIVQMEPHANIIFFDMELMEFATLNKATELYAQVKSKLKEGVANYLFIDEVQEIEDFEQALRSLLNEQVVDIWCTGSNASVLSGELADRLSGRFVEIPVHSLSYPEFLKFHSVNNDNSSLQLYMKYGGLPNLIHLPLTDEVVFDYLKTINATVMLKDVVKRHEVRNVAMLENLMRFLADNTGSLFSANSISKFMKAQGQKISVAILTNYIQYALDAFYLAKVQRIDLQGKRHFETNEKYYFEDHGLRNAWIGYQPMHINKLIENIVFKHLLVNGYRMFVGISAAYEVDFIAEKDNKKLYVQCAYLMESEQTRQHEFRTLLSIRDNFPKLVVTMDEPSGGNIEGVEHWHLRDFLSRDW
ncbi:MAG: ATP-binding protein [Bacteroidales bacterium]|nr:ATP-binding protein [Bacteroidales bacterium]